MKFVLDPGFVIDVECFDETDTYYEVPIRNHNQKEVSLIEEKDERLNLISLFINKYISNNSLINSKDGGYSYDTSVLNIFAKRYREGKLSGSFTHSDYINNTDIQSMLERLQIDSDQFWFLLLFIYDYTYDTFYGLNSPSPTKETNSIHICHFARQFHQFIQLPTLSDNNKGFINKPLLISKLIFYVGLTTDESYCHSSNQLRSVIIQYKNNEVNSKNSIYFIC